MSYMKKARVIEKQIVFPQLSLNWHFVNGALWSRQLRRCNFIQAAMKVGGMQSTDIKRTPVVS